MRTKAKPTNPKITPLLAGVAGEYFVAAELSRRGHIASISLRNTRGIDILATNAEASRSVNIQCKTNQLSRTSWMLNDKCESFASDSHFYVFVVLDGPLERPRYHVVPSAQYSLGVMYANGDGVTKDDAEAYKWWLLAGAQGDETAKENNGVIEKRLTSEQRAEGQKRFRAFKKK